MSTPQATSLEDRFVAWLMKLVQTENRAALAALRRGLGKPPAEQTESHRYILPFVNKVYEEDSYYLIGSLFALHQENVGDVGQKKPNFGESFAILKQKSKSDSVERRFIALLNSDSEDLEVHLRSVVTLMKSHNIQINWALLLKQLHSWSHEERWVQRDWARSFWQFEMRPDIETETTLPEE